MGTGDVPEDMILAQLAAIRGAVENGDTDEALRCLDIAVRDASPRVGGPKILDHMNHVSYLEMATYGGHDDGEVDSITVECTKCGEVVTTLWEEGAENDE